MYPLFQELIYQAESHYLKTDEIERLNVEISTLKERLELYKTLRDQEIEIFQEVADQLVLKLENESERNLENCLRQWLLTSRYCAMAMLLNNPEFLERRLLEWLTEIVQVHQTQTISDTLYSLLMRRLKKILSEQEFLYLQPFFSQAYNYFQQTPALSS
jgi:hypothetical protein